MRFFFKDSNPALEYKIDRIAVEEKVDCGWAKLTLTLSDINGDQAAGSVTMTLAEPDLMRMSIELKRSRRHAA
jgi:hypothetical protein